MTNQEFLDYVTKRDDAAWAHPELQNTYTAGLDKDVEALYDTALSAEQKKELAASLEAMIPETELNEERLQIVDVPGCPEEPETTAKVYIVRPKSKKKKLPVLFKVLPGGLVLSDPAKYPLDKIAAKYKAVIVACRYRTILDENGAYPAALNDLHAAYQYLIDHATDLGINPEKIVLEGENAGGQLALSLTHRLKRYGMKARGCVVNMPIADDRTDHLSAKLEGTGWTGAALAASGKALMNGYEGEKTAEAFANYASIEDCIGLTPTFLHTAEEDPGADACMEYATKLKSAGVYTEVHLWGGTNHTALGLAAAADPDLEYVQLFHEIYDNDIKDCFKYDFGRSFLEDEANLPSPEVRLNWYDMETPTDTYSINSPLKAILKSPKALGAVLKALGPKFMDQQKAQKAEKAAAAPAEEEPKEEAPKEKKPLKESIGMLKDVVSLAGAMTPLRLTDSLPDITNAELLDLEAKLNKIRKK